MGRVRWLVKRALWMVAAIVLAACSAAAPSSPQPTDEPTPTARPTANATATPELTPTSDPTATPEPTVRPTPTPIPSATPEPGFVSRTMLGDDWPLTVESGVLVCSTAMGGEAVLFRATGGPLYTVNGTAQTYYPDLPSIDPIWAAGTYAPKKNIKPLIDLGLALC